MEWKELQLSTKNVVERCWRFDDDKPLSFTTKINDTVSAQKITEQTYTEILAYQKSFPYFDVKREKDVITVSGNCEFGEWLKVQRSH